MALCACLFALSMPALADEWIPFDTATGKAKVSSSGTGTLSKPYDFTDVEVDGISGGGGAPTDVDYLVGTASAGLTTEIVVGTSPGGELGGSWASPTVDDGVTVTGWELGASTATTAPADDNDTSLATTAFVQGELAGTLSSVLTGKTIWVDGTNGNNSTGTRGRIDLPFLTISGAVGASGITSGDLIYVLPGTYTENSGFTLPSGVNLKGSGIDVTVITSTLAAGVNKTVLVPGTNSVVSDLTVNATADAPALGCKTSDATFTGALLINVKAFGFTDTFAFTKVATTSMTIINGIFTSNFDVVLTSAGTPSLTFWNCSFSSDGETTKPVHAVAANTGTIKLYNCTTSTINASATEDNVALYTNGGTLEAHNVVIHRDTSGLTKKDIGHYSGTININNVTRDDGAVLAVDGTYTDISRYLYRDNNLSDVVNAGTARTNLGLGTLATQNGTFSGTSSGTNTGDQTSIVGITGTKAQFDTAVTDGNFLYVGDVTQYTDELAQDAVGGMIDSSLTYVDGTPLLQRAALTGVVTASAGSNTTVFADADLDTWATITPGAGVGTFLATPSSANLASAVTGETGSGPLVFATAPTFTAPTTSTANFNVAAGTLETTPSDGDVEADANCIYGTTDAGNRGYIPIRQIIRADATVTQANDANPHAIFTTPANGRLTVEAGTYRFHGMLAWTSMSATSGNIKVDILGAGTATTTGWLWIATGQDQNPAQAAAIGGGYHTTSSSGASIVTAGTSASLGVMINGTFEVTGAGTIIPTQTVVTAAAAVLSVGSFIEFWRIGSTSETSVGQWD